MDNHHTAPTTTTSSEVRAKRRTFTAAQKLAILREIDACPAGQQGEVLRKHGIYSSHLTKWRRQRAAGTLVPTKRGPKVDEHAKQLARLERENARLMIKLQKSELIIDAQKKLLHVLGLPEPDLSDLDEPK